MTIFVPDSNNKFLERKLSFKKLAYKQFSFGAIVNKNKMDALGIQKTLLKYSLYILQINYPVNTYIHIEEIYISYICMKNDARLHSSHLPNCAYLASFLSGVNTWSLTLNRRRRVKLKSHEENRSVLCALSTSKNMKYEKLNRFKRSVLILSAISNDQWQIIQLFFATCVEWCAVNIFAVDYFERSIKLYNFLNSSKVKPKCFCKIARTEINIIESCKLHEVAKV